MADLVLPQTKEALKDEVAKWRDKAERASKSAGRWAEENAELVQTVAAYGGAMVTGPVSAGATGYLETRFPNKDGTMLSLGPIPLPLVVAGLGLAGSVAVKNPVGRFQLLSVVSSNMGLWTGTVGRGYGATARAKKLKDESKKAAKSGTAGVEIGASAHSSLPAGSDWSQEERALLGLE